MHSPNRAFTIIELLVVVGVVGVLLGLLLPALAQVKASGRQTGELNAARQLMAAYTAYAAASKDFVLPGHAIAIPTSSKGRPIRAYDAKGTEITGSVQLDQARKRYLWRLAPYLSYNLRGFYTSENAELLERLEQEDYTSYLYKASISPSLGLNSEWVGGDSDAYGFLPPESPLRSALDFSRYYITSMSQALKPGKLLVFASARGVDPDSGVAGGAPVEGYFRVTSPYFTELTGPRWSPEFVAGEPPVNYGFLSPRYGGNVVTAFIDGHADVMDKRKIRDMRYWANWATSADWKLPKLTP